MTASGVMEASPNTGKETNIASHHYLPLTRYCGINCRLFTTPSEVYSYRSMKLLVFVSLGHNLRIRHDTAAIPSCLLGRGELLCPIEDPKVYLRLSRSDFSATCGTWSAVTASGTVISLVIHNDRSLKTAS